MSEFTNCNNCNMLLPSSKYQEHLTRRQYICSTQQFCRLIRWRDIYIECPCGTFILQSNIRIHLNSAHHRSFVENKPYLIHHPFFQRERRRQIIHGGNIPEVNIRIWNSIQLGRQFMLFYSHHSSPNIPNLEPLMDEKIQEIDQPQPIEIITKQDKFIPTFFMNFVKELMDASNIKNECSICLDTLHSENIFILPCFHILCIECNNKIRANKCPFCRKEY